MITAADTNILLDILIPNEQFYQASANALQQAAGEGALVIADIVCGTLHSCLRNFAFISKTSGSATHFSKSNEIRVQALTREAHFLASRAWRIYRRQGGKRTRILADFLVAAHAQKQATRLLSRDRGFYRKLFPTLDLHGPTVRRPLPS